MPGITRIEIRDPYDRFLKELLELRIDGHGTLPVYAILPASGATGCLAAALMISTIVLR
jgi:hypothetical protein